MMSSPSNKPINKSILTEWSGMTSACTNPILYGFLNESFKNEFKEMYVCAFLETVAFLNLFYGNLKKLKKNFQVEPPECETEVCGGRGGSSCGEGRGRGGSRSSRIPSEGRVPGTSQEQATCSD